MNGGVRIALACDRCDEIFTRRSIDAARSRRQFCSRACLADTMRTGRTRVEVVCCGCLSPFMKIATEMRRRGSLKNYCSAKCYHAHVDRARLGRLGGSVPKYVPAAQRFLRSQKAGLARARNLTRQELRAIALKGVAARMANRTERRGLDAPRIRSGLQFTGPLLQRKLARRAAGERRPKRRAWNEGEA